MDIFGLYETLCQDLSIADLEVLDRYKFVWNWLPANGHSSGIILGIKEDIFEVDDMNHGSSS